VLAVGDAGTQVATPTAKAGVYAVRQGPFLLENLRRSLGGSAPRPFVPQRSFLKLLNTGDFRAIGEWRGLSFEGQWCWWLKKRIDLSFVRRYQPNLM
jgi:selenide,water dikinase